MRSEAIRENLKAIREYVSEIEKMHRSTEVVQMKAQLSEINKAIRQLEKRGIQVPSGLISDKSSLESNVKIVGEAPDEILLIYRELIDVISHIGLAIRRRPDVDFRDLLKERRKQTTSSEVLRKTIIAVLEGMDGTGSVREVLKSIEEKLNDQFTLADKDRPHGRSFRWQSNARKERNRMIKDGLLTPESKRGKWTLMKRDKFKPGLK